MEPGPINPWWTVDESIEDVPAPVRRDDRETAARSTESAADSEEAGQKADRETMGFGEKNGEPDRPELE